ncbi:protein PLANT CADMIUM RESISTANCE 10-like [Pistacia vera]|uniref:protein PLANT CADMIUM RESISTANCE 10-like n=1 Tax=Pistacia vera TaxID=55513 RepID=UPI0012638F83|nr:protein PLANT CADMIUM RESISTANCE 10-like [Pistacia vera]
MADVERQEKVGEEGERLLEGMAVVNFELLCSTVALQTQGKFNTQPNEEVEMDADGDEFGAVLRMWEGEVLDCFDDRRIALESACCPCYRFGKNMGRAGFGSCFIQASVYLFLAIGGLANFIAFIVTKSHCFLYLAMAFAISIGGYLGFYRTQIKRKFNILGCDSSMDDCVYHVICPCCTLSQEARTLEMNNVQDGTWHGRGDTICIGSYSEGSRAFFELHPPPVSTKCPDPCSMQKSADVVITLEPGKL